MPVASPFKSPYLALIWTGVIWCVIGAGLVVFYGRHENPFVLGVALVAIGLWQCFAARRHFGELSKLWSEESPRTMLARRSQAGMLELWEPEGALRLRFEPAGSPGLTPDGEPVSVYGRLEQGLVLVRTAAGDYLWPRDRRQISRVR